MRDTEGSSNLSVTFSFLLFVDEQYSIVCKCSLFFHLPVDEHFDCFQFFALWDDAALDMIFMFYEYVLLVLCVDVCFCLYWIHRSAVAESHGNYVFKFMRNCQTVFSSNCMFCFTTSNVPGVLRPHHRLELTVFQVLEIIILIPVSLVTDDVEYLFMYLFVIHVSSLVMCL